MSSVKIGIGFGLWRLGMPSPDTICSYAERAEAVGIDSIWLSDHIVSRNPELEISCIIAMFAARTKKIQQLPIGAGEDTDIHICLRYRTNWMFIRKAAPPPTLGAPKTNSPGYEAR